MTPRQLRQLGSLAYGRNWQTALANTAGLSRGMVWRYANGITPISKHTGLVFASALRRDIALKIAELQGGLKLLP